MFAICVQAAGSGRASGSIAVTGRCSLQETPASLEDSTRRAFAEGRFFVGVLRK
jgi:hypothetical protein